MCGQTPEELQQLIDCYCDYCGENGLLVNPAKCEAMSGTAVPDRAGADGPCRRPAAAALP
jgi:hypothetical protein